MGSKFNQDENKDGKVQSKGVSKLEVPVGSKEKVGDKVDGQCSVGEGSAWKIENINLSHEQTRPREGEME